MKNIKKITAMLMATVMTAGAVSSMTAGAMYHARYFDEMNAWMQDFYEISKSETELWGKTISENEHPNATYYVSKSNENLTVLVDEAKSSSLTIWISSDTELEAFEKIVKDICPEANVSRGMCDYENWIEVSVKGYDGKLPFEKARKKYISFNDARDIHDRLEEITEIKQFSYFSDRIAYTPCTHYLASYNKYSYDDNFNRYGGLDEKIQKYITENDLKWHIDTDYDYMNSDYFAVVPDGEASTLDIYNIANEIYKLTGAMPLSSYNPQETDVNESTLTIEMHDKIDGDANNDGELTLADAIVTLQSIGNPEKYGINGSDETHITYQGSFNADITGDYDGITSADALAIQRKILGLNKL